MGSDNEQFATLKGMQTPPAPLRSSDKVAGGAGGRFHSRRVIRHWHSDSIRQLAASAVLVTAVTYAATNTCIKSLSRTDTPVQITIYGNLLALPIAFVPALFVWHTPTWQDVPWIIAMALFQTCAGLFHARSVQAADARVVQPFNFLRLPASVLLAWYLFAELPSHWTWLGATLIFASSYYVLYQEGSPRRAAQKNQSD